MAFGLFEALKPFKCIVVCPNCEGSSVQVVAEMLDSVHHIQYLLHVVAVPTPAVLKHSAGICYHFDICELRQASSFPCGLLRFMASRSNTNGLVCFGFLVASRLQLAGSKAPSSIWPKVPTEVFW